MSVVQTSSSSPPSSNRRVWRTQNAAGTVSGVFIDWLTVNLPPDAGTFAELVSRVGALGQRAGGWRGHYDRSATFGDGGTVAWCSDRERGETQGVLLNLPGTACASLGTELVPFLEWCCERGHVTRLDVAIDDHAGLLTYQRVHDAVEGGSMVSKARKARWVIGKDPVTGERRGWTFYLGAPGSDAMIRCYDKTAERLAKGHKTDGKACARVELQARHDYADKLARAVLRDPSEGLAQIAEKIRFCVPSATDTNRRRWPLAPWWEEFLDGVQPGGSLTCGEVQECTIEKMEATFIQQNAAIVATLIEAHGGDLAWFFNAADIGESRKKPKHHAAVAAFKAQQAVQATVQYAAIDEADLTITAADLAAPIVLSPDVVITAADLDFHLGMDLFGDAVG